MKAMCIKQGEWISVRHKVFCKNAPKFGEEVTVLRESPQNPDFWELLEYPLNDFGEPNIFLKKHFIPLSEIDEMELVNEQELQEA